MKKNIKPEMKKVKIFQPIRGTNWNDYYVGEKNYYQYGLTEQDVMKSIDNMPITIDQNRKL